MVEDPSDPRSGPGGPGSWTSRIRRWSRASANEAKSSAMKSSPPPSSTASYITATSSRSTAPATDSRTASPPSTAKPTSPNLGTSIRTRLGTSVRRPILVVDAGDGDVVACAVGRPVWLVQPAKRTTSDGDRPGATRRSFLHRRPFRATRRRRIRLRALPPVGSRRRGARRWGSWSVTVRPSAPSWALLMSPASSSRSRADGRAWVSWIWEWAAPLAQGSEGPGQQLAPLERPDADADVP